MKHVSLRAGLLVILGVLLAILVETRATEVEVVAVEGKKKKLGNAQFLEPCTKNNDCASGRCKERSCAAKKRSRENYAACRYNDECKSRKCTGAMKGASQKTYGLSKSQQQSLSPWEQKEAASWRHGYCRGKTVSGFGRRYLPIIQHVRLTSTTLFDSRWLDVVLPQ